MKRVAPLFVGALLVFLACEEDVPTDPGTDPPASLAAAAADDAPRFTFLPPLASPADASGEFDGSLPAVVEICEWTDAGCMDGVTRYTRSGQGSERVRVDTGAGQYIVNWHMKRTGAEAGELYRVRVLVEEAELGHVDVLAVRRGERASGADGAVPVQVGSTVPIKFRAVVGAVPPTASFTVRGGAEAGSPIGFDGSGSSDYYGGELTYAWDFGDAGRGGGQSVAHVYATGGTYTATLVVTNAYGSSGTAQRAVAVAEAPAATGEATAIGIVTDGAGEPLAGVTARVGGGATGATSNDAGRVTLDGLPTGRAVTIALSRDGYVQQYVRVDIPTDVPTTYFERAMVRRDPPQTLAAAENGGEVTAGDGASVELPPGALVDGDGDPVTGDVTVTITPLDVSSDEIDAFPGSFTGVREDGETGLLVTYGVAEFELTQGGGEVQLALGATATIEIPIYTGGAAVGDEIPLWSLDEATGVWIAEDLGTVVSSADSPSGLALRAEVSHFSWWNIDKFVSEPFRPHIRCTADGAPVACSLVAAVDDPSFPATQASADLPPEGSTLDMPVDVDIDLTALSTDGTRRGTLTINGGSGETPTIDIALDEVAPSPATSVVTVSDDSIAVGDTGTVTLQARDAAGDPMFAGGDAVAFQAPFSTGASRVTFGPVTDHGDGSYTATYTGFSSGAPATVQAILNGLPVASTAEVTVTLGSVSAAQSVVTVSSSTAAIGEDVTLTLRLKDEGGNDVPVSGASVFFTLTTGALVSAGTIGPVTDNGDGSYTATFTATRSGTPTTIGAVVFGAPITSPLPTIEVGAGALTAAQAQALIAESFLTYWQGTQELVGGAGISMMLSAAADEGSSSWFNFGMHDISTEPRNAWNNDPDYRSSGATLSPWLRMYLALSAVHDGVQAVEGGLELGGPGGPDNARALAFGKLVQGLAHGWLALMFDQAFIFDESVDLATDMLTLEPYPTVMAAAIAELEEVIAIADANSFTLPSTWINGAPLTNTELSRLAHSYIARFMAQVARTPAERAAVDWNAVVSHIDQGVQADFAPEGDGSSTGWYDLVKALGSQAVWMRADYRTIGGVAPDDPETDASGGLTGWLATPVADRMPYTLDTGDRRVWDGTYDIGGDPNPGTDFAWNEFISFRPERGTYHFSYYVHTRYQDHASTFTGPMPVLTVTEMDLLKAEALYRLGQTGVAALVNLTRVGRGELSPTSDADPDLFDKLVYEKRIETFHTGAGVAYFDRRGLGDPVGPNAWGHGLVEGTPHQFPVPGAELERLGLPNYTFGGTTGGMMAGAPRGAAAGAVRVPAWEVYSFRQAGAAEEKLARLRGTTASGGALEARRR